MALAEKYCSQIKYAHHIRGVLQYLLVINCISLSDLLSFKELSLVQVSFNDRPSWLTITTFTWMLCVLGTGSWSGHSTSPFREGAVLILLRPVMPPLAQPWLGPAAGSGASDANWRLWNTCKYLWLYSDTLCSTSSPLQSPHSTWLEERRWTQLLVCCPLPMGTDCVEQREIGLVLALQPPLPWLR